MTDISQAVDMMKTLREIPIDPIRICPERDGPCPHGRGCPFWIDAYRCDIAASRALLAHRVISIETEVSNV